MNNQDLKAIHLTVISIGFKLKALEKSLTADQKLIFEASLKESRALVKETLAKSLNPEELQKLLHSLEIE